jgi:hypothetical protein
MLYSHSKLPASGIATIWITDPENDKWAVLFRYFVGDEDHLETWT